MSTNPPPGDPNWSSPWAPPPAGAPPVSGQPGGYPADSYPPQPTSGYPDPTAPTSGYPDPNAAYPTSGYPDPVSAYPASGYPDPNAAYAGANAWGTPGPAPGYPLYAPPRKQNGLALASMITSIATLLLCMGIPSIVGAIMGHKAKKQIQETGEEGEGFALAGIIVGWIGFAIGALFILYFVFVFGILAWAISTTPDSTY